MRREERVTVQGPVKEQQPDGMSHRGGDGPAFSSTEEGRHTPGSPCWGGRCGWQWQQKPSNDPRHNQHNPRYANYWAPLTRTRHIPPHPAQPRHTNDWAPRTRKRHQREHRPQRPTERSDLTQHAKGRAGDCPGPRHETATRRNVTRGGGACGGSILPPHVPRPIPGLPALSPPHPLVLCMPPCLLPCPRPPPNGLRPFLWRGVQGGTLPDPMCVCAGDRGSRGEAERQHQSEHSRDDREKPGVGAGLR